MPLMLHAAANLKSSILIGHVVFHAIGVCTSIPTSKNDVNYTTGLQGSDQSPHDSTWNCLYNAQSGLVSTGEIR